jgi:cytochrome b
MDSPRDSTAAASVRAWDLPTRLFHWTLVLLILAAWLTYEFAEPIGDETLVWHRVSGLAVLVLVVWRALWGFAGSSTSRFAGFLRGPVAWLSYAGGLVTGRAQRYLGHNPLGALMVVTLLSVVAGQAGFGLFAVDDNDLVGGPLYRLISEDGNQRAAGLHGLLFDNVLLPLVGIHVLANVFYALVKREPLIRAMVTGRKPAEDYEDAGEAKIIERPLLRAAVCLAAATLIVLGGIVALGGRLSLY